MASDEEKLPAGLLDKEDILNLGTKYKIELNPEDNTQYKLCVVIKWLESQIPKSSE
jgi:hypothetical protein